MVITGTVQDGSHRARRRATDEIRDADSQTVKNKADCIALGFTRNGQRKVLGLLIAENEGAKFWFSIMNELKNLGVHDILIAVVDGLSAFRMRSRRPFLTPWPRLALCIWCAIL
nr:transposase [Roseovarius bejariae]